MNLFDDNHAYLQMRTDVHIKPGWCRWDADWQTPPSREELPALVLQFGEQRQTVHSPYYPVRDAAKLAAALVPAHDTLVVLGIGLGYHLQSLAQKHLGCLVVIEPDKHLFNLALHHTSLRALGGRVTYIVGHESFEAPRLAAVRPGGYDIVELTARTRLLPDYFAQVKQRLEGRPAYELSDRWRYRKFATPQARIIFIDSGYVLTKECLETLNGLGQQVRYVHIDRDNYDYAEFVRSFLSLIAEFRPDFVLTINHLGFDQEGRLTELLSELEIPYASWYVDSPTIVLSESGTNVSDWCSIFVWDRDYIDDVHQRGYPHVDYLPLATLPSLFRPLELPQRYDISFVGSSMVYSTHKNLRRLVYRPDLLRQLEPTALRFLELDTRYVPDAMDALEREGETYRFDSDDQREDFLAAVLWRATQVYRLGGLDKLAPFYPDIFGDPNWDDLLRDGRYHIHREVMYYDGLATLYNQSRLNFNMTSRQMKNAVNQRVFDAPACGAFLLTDYKAQLDEIFTGNGSDVVFFNDVNEIPDLVSYYLGHEDERRRIAQAGRESILRAHTYRHRLDKLLNVMRIRYGADA
ncbi:MAG: glycosyltransferase [Candidatus Cloacimonetes bacterium]|nr:glycosyltransferase [Candidatus Cloacimonadota bacterium]